MKPAELDADERLFLKREQWAMRKSGRIAPVLPPNDLLWMIWERVDILTQQALLQRAMGRLDVPADLEDTAPELIEDDAMLLSAELQKRGFAPQVAERAAMLAALAGLEHTHAFEGALGEEEEEEAEEEEGDEEEEEEEGGHEPTYGKGTDTASAAGRPGPMLRGQSTLGATLLAQRLGRAARSRRLKKAGKALPPKSLAPPPSDDFIAAGDALQAPSKRSRRRPKRFSAFGHFASQLVAEQRSKPVGASKVLGLMKRR